jgi:hypothetical protein
MTELTVAGAKYLVVAGATNYRNWADARTVGQHGFQWPWSVGDAVPAQAVAGKAARVAGVHPGSSHCKRGATGLARRGLAGVAGKGLQGQSNKGMQLAA